MKKFLVYSSSATQRLVATRKDNGEWLLTKEWRKDKKEGWTTGKGILLPIYRGKPTSFMLGYLLVNDGAQNMGLKLLEETGDGSNDKASNNYSHKTAYHRSC